MRSLLLVLFSSLLSFGQSTKISPDCDIPFTFTGAGTSQITGCAQNLQGVTYWHMTYQSVGFTGLTITVQEAPDAGGTPGSWSTFTAATGSNPQTSITGVGADSTYSSYAPWVRVDLSGLTGSGTVTGHLYGCRTPGCGGSASASSGPSANQNIRAIGAGFDGAGTALTTGAVTYVTIPFACTIAAFNITVDTGTVSLDVWKVGTGTAIPTVANTILTGGYLALSSGTAIHSASTALFTTVTVTANDICGFEIEAVSSATKVSLVLQCNATS